jgi:hypothetical protein
MLSNAILAVGIQNSNGLDTNTTTEEAQLRSKQNLYFAVILYSTFGLSLVRFIGVSFSSVNLLRPEWKTERIFSVLVLLAEEELVPMV